jgi:diguanylate cyclase (GGDEF)-like protein
MSLPTNSDLPVDCTAAASRRRQTLILCALFACLMMTQALGFLILGTGRTALGLSGCVLVLDNLVALVCAWTAFRRADGVTALFWFLFSAVLTILLVPTALQAFDTVFDQALLTDSTRGVLYCFYGAPILMMLFVPETHRRSRVKSEVLLDLFQVAIVVGLIYYTFFFLPVQHMLSADAVLRNVSISDEQSLLLLFAALVRLQFARLPRTRNLLLRLGSFLVVCAVATLVGDWIDVHHYAVGPWFDLGWAIPNISAALIAFTWFPSTEPQSKQQAASFPSFLGTNLVLVSVLSCSALLLDRWKQAYGETLASVAIAASLLAFTFRLALTQFHQQQEIAQREAAQLQLTLANQKVGRLLDGARRQNAEITQVSELGSLLQACVSQEEAFRLIPERLRRLFPGASGSVSLLSASKNRVVSAATWGIRPADEIFSPDECWALRRGATHTNPRGHTASRCPHLLGDGDSICIPLIANSEAIGTLSIEETDLRSPFYGLEAVNNSRDNDYHYFNDHVDDALDAEALALDHRRKLAVAVAEHIAVAVANLNLRESLRLQAVRDPLTGLYNRRYMQEFLERELHSARRKHRSLAVMMLDLDHFKRYNDNFGHAAGDKALAAVGETLLRAVRAEDVACRYGGEEFALILPECSLYQATIRAEEIRARLKAYPAQSNRQNEDVKPLTVSIGVAAFDETTDQVDLLLKFADEALYEAKRAGRDRVVAARPAAPLPDPDLDEIIPATIV